MESNLTAPLNEHEMDEEHKENKDHKEHHVWIATGFSVRAASASHAEAHAAKWLTGLLAIADLPLDQSLAVKSPAQGMHRSAVLAVQLMALQKEEDKIHEYIDLLRAQQAQLVEEKRQEERHP